MSERSRREVPSKSKHSIRPGKRRKQPMHINEKSVQQTVVTRVPEAITENDDSQDPACVSSHQHRRRVRDESAARADGEEDHKTERKDPSSHGRARGVPGSAKNKAGKTPLVPRTGQSKVRNWSVKSMQRRLQESRSRRRATLQQPRGDWPDQPCGLDGRAQSRCTVAMTTCET